MSFAFPVHQARADAFPDYLSIWFPQWFGEPDDGPDPGETLQAPFTSPSKVPDNPGLGIGVPHSYDLTQNPADLSQPHRNADQIAEWLIRAIAEVLSIDPEPKAFQAHIDRLSTGMDKYAISNFQDFLSQSGTLRILREQNLVLSSVVEEKPVLLNEGVVDGRYRWLFQMPVTMSFSARGQRDIDQAPRVHQKIELTLQVGRVSGGVQGSAIESWQAKKIVDDEDKAR